jgi:hypothetical protein
VKEARMLLQQARAAVAAAESKLYRTSEWQTLKRAETEVQDAEQILRDELLTQRRSEYEERNRVRQNLHLNAIAQGKRLGLRYMQVSDKKRRIEDGHWWCDKCLTQFFLFIDARDHECKERRIDANGRIVSKPKSKSDSKTNRVNARTSRADAEF